MPRSTFLINQFKIIIAKEQLLYWQPFQLVTVQSGRTFDLYRVLATD